MTCNSDLRGDVYEVGPFSRPCIAVYAARIFSGLLGEHIGRQHVAVHRG